MNKIKAFFNTAKSKLTGLNYKRAGKSLGLAVLATAIVMLFGFVLACILKAAAFLLGASTPFLLIGGFIIWAAVETYNDRFIFINDRAILAEDDKTDSVLV